MCVLTSSHGFQFSNGNAVTELFTVSTTTTMTQDGDQQHEQP